MKRVNTSERDRTTLPWYSNEIEQRVSESICHCELKHSSFKKKTPRMHSQYYMLLLTHMRSEHHCGMVWQSDITMRWRLEAPTQVPEVKGSTLGF